MKTTARRRQALLASMLAVLALMVGLVGVAAARPANVISIGDFQPANGSTVPAGQTVTVSAFITTDSPIALVDGQPDVDVFIDGTAADAQFVVGSGAVRVGFQVNRSFDPGSHTVIVSARNVDAEMAEAQWSFTASEAAPTGTVSPTVTAAPTGTPAPTATVAPTGTPAATATAAPTVTAAPTATPTAVPTRTVVAVAAPQQLPPAGGPPLELAVPVLSGLAAALVGLGLRLRAR